MTFGTHARKITFDLQLSPKFFSDIWKGTNHRACAEGVGLGVTGREMKDYRDYVAFDDAEIYSSLGSCLQMA